MSIATDEAEKKYPVPTDADDPMCKYVDGIAGCPAAKREGYVAGRTAEPTAAEIEAGAEALCEYYEDDELTDDRRIAALLVLYAAYDSVTE